MSYRLQNAVFYEVKRRFMKRKTTYYFFKPKCIEQIWKQIK